MKFGRAIPTYDRLYIAFHVSFLHEMVTSFLFTKVFSLIWYVCDVMQVMPTIAFGVELSVEP